MRHLLSLIFLIVGFAESLFGQVYIPPLPTDLSGTKISLLTVGIGEEIYARFGHTMIRIEDPSHNLDYLVNWGMFDFSDPKFVPKFFRGVLIYKMAFTPTGPTVKYYRDVENRSVIQDEVSLTDNQKRQFMEKIIWNSQPENVSYPYQYFRNNCATMPRDYLDFVTKGFIRKSFESILVPLTFRDYIRWNLGNNPFFAWGLDVIFNGDTDHKLTKWQEMFYPLKLREYLAKIQAVDDEGHADPKRAFLSNNRVLADRPESIGQHFDGYHLTWFVAGVPLIILLVSLMRRFRAQMPSVARPWHLRTFGLVCLWWGLTSGFFGLTHFSGWAFSTHTDLHHNVNILLFWPVDMLVLIPGVQMGILGHGWNSQGFLKIGFWRKFAIFHIVIIPVYLATSLSGIVHQDVSRVVFYMAPLSLLYYVVLARLSDERMLPKPSLGV